MPWHEFLFSEKKQVRQLRHALFWLAWYCYFVVSFYIYQQPLHDKSISPFYLGVGPLLLLKTLLLLQLFALACYPLLYIVLPGMLKGKRISALFYVVLIAGFLLVTAHILYWKVFPGIDRLYGITVTPRPVAYYWPAVNLGLLHFTKVAAVAVLIRYVKNWQQQQKRNEQLAKEKLETELQFLKAQVQPGFLIQTLHQVYQQSVKASPLAPEMILRLSDLLSYMLYECDQYRVPLVKEIEMVKHYINLGRTQYRPPTETVISVKGDLSGKYISPLLLIPFIENSFQSIASATEQTWVNLDIRVHANSFSFKLVHGIPAAAATDPPFSPVSSLSNAEKRLGLLYPGYHDLKITRELEMFIILLQLDLDAPVHIMAMEQNGYQQQPDFSPPQNKVNYA